MTTIRIRSSNGVSFYTVTFGADGRAPVCNCQGFGFRRTCRHIAEAERKLEEQHQLQRHESRVGTVEDLYGQPTSQQQERAQTRLAMKIARMQRAAEQEARSSRAPRR